jgi:hypothetical protein
VAWNSFGNQSLLPVKMPALFFETEPISGAYFRLHFVSPREGITKNAAIKEIGFFKWNCVRLCGAGA